jgi:EAL domain-containing protein (putative c-di-GMP-specific phosphodiesterase class I)
VFVNHLKNALDTFGVDPDNIEVELTESVLVEDMAVTMKIFDSLRAINIQSALDDFGTGYSSLSYLKMFPIDRLKIDQSFIKDIDNKNNLAIIKAIIAMAKSMDLSVIAEGVETDEQRSILLQFECDEIQGYLIGKPCPIEDFIKLYKNYGEDV